MKKVLLGSLMVGGLLFAQNSDMPKNQRLSGNEKEALNTQSPRVRTKHHKKNTARTDHVTKDKHTINAYVPPGK